MKTSRWIAAALALAGVGAQAQSLQMPNTYERYLELSYVPLRVSVGSVGSEVTNLGRMMLGVRTHPHVDVEAMVATGLDDVTTGSTHYGKITRSLGLFVKPGVDIGAGLRAYARVGIIDTRLESSSGGTNYSDRSTAMGLGVSYRLTDRISLVADYVRYADLHLVTVDGASLGLAMRF